jgi:uncharacterized protein YjbJ (UPF0337 family)
MSKKHDDDSVGEEISAFGQRTKGAIKEGVGAVTGNRSLEREGEAENAMGNARQENNDILGETDGVRGNAGLGTGTGTGRTGGRLVTGLYRTPDEAQRAYEDLTTRHGYKKDDVSVIMSDDTRKKYYGDVKPGEELAGEGSKAMEGMGIGSAVGGTLGAIIAGLAAAGTALALPGLGLVIAGPIAAALAGAGAGGATGGLVGALIGSGIPEDRAAEYEQGIREGGIVIGTNARDDEHARALENDFRNYGGSNVTR